MAVHVNERNFNRIVNSEIPVLIDFWAPWCGPCRMLGPVLEDISREFRGKVKVVKLNIDENQEIAAQLRVSSVPTVMIFRNGRVIDRFVGFMPKAAIAARLERLI